MLPYLIAGAIGFGIGKLFEEGGEAGEKYVNGGGVSEYFKKFENDFYTTRRGGVKNYSVDIDLENGEQLRGGDLDFKDGNDALFLYERIKKKGEYQNEKIENIQLIANFKNGDYESIHIPRYVNGGGVGKYKMYKLRAEGLNDFINFLGTGVYFNVKSFTVEPIGVPDVVVSFETNLSLSEIKAKLREVQDSHVMLETIKPIKEYTGERYAGGGSIDNDLQKLQDTHEKIREILIENGSEEYGDVIIDQISEAVGISTTLSYYDEDEEYVKPTKVILKGNSSEKELQKLKDTHEKIREILIENGSEEYGDVIIDQISEVVGIPTTLDYYDEDEYAVGGVAKKRRRSASAQ